MRSVHYYSSLNSRRLILFCTGWGTTPGVISHLALPIGCDLCCCYDYTNLSEDDLPPLEDYDDIVLIAWSMGVWVAQILAQGIPHISSAIAINGTPYPIHDEWGIPKKIFEETLSRLDDGNRKKFDLRMCGGKSLAKVYEAFSSRSTESLKRELESLHKGLSLSAQEGSFNLEWTRAIISEKDLIIPATNQIRYWQAIACPYTILQGVSHYPFLYYKRWEDIIG